MAQNITIMGASYSAVPAVTLPKTGGGTATFTDVGDTTATAADVAQGTYFYTAAGVRTAGTASGGEYEIAVDPSSQVGAAQAGTAVTSEANYTPSGDVRTVSASVSVVDSVAIGYSYAGYVLSITGAVVSAHDVGVLTGASFDGSPVHLVVRSAS